MTHDMPESPTQDVDSPETAPEAAELTVEAYETDEGVVFYDAAEPTAWLQAGTAVRLDEMA
ncbi:DUF7331 family protein [Halosegnis marinus]|uniref:Uncharacterized protein n=1 Tax=Halosegnis marinus TaxID=3034023 RepID=A0ABD5ZRD2_9EURY|nr:hypothetical protein [Halosegnis sp. DT85]